MWEGDIGSGTSVPYAIPNMPLFPSFRSGPQSLFSSLPQTKRVDALGGGIIGLTPMAVLHLIAEALQTNP